MAVLRTGRPAGPDRYHLAGMSTLPQPPALGFPPPAGEPQGQDAPPAVLLPGRLVPAWRATFMVGWGGVVLALAGVWKASRTMGLSTWWLGPAADPRPFPVQALPFAVAAVVLVAATRHVRFLPLWGGVAALALAAIAAGDVGRFDRLALVQLAIAGAALLVSVAAVAGMVPRERSDGEN